MKKILQTLVIVLLFSSTSNAQWVATFGPGADINFIGYLGTKIFAGEDAVFATTDTGTTWAASNTGITDIPKCFATRGANIFVGTGSGMFLSIDNGSTWNPINTGLTTTYSKLVYSIAISGTNIFIGTDAGVFLSTNDGGLWTAVNTGSYVKQFTENPKIIFLF